MAFTPEQHREYRAKLRSMGICIVCHKAEAEGGAVCAECLKRNNERRNDMRKSGSRCHDCCNPLDEFSISVGRVNCPVCSEKRLVQQRRRREKKRC
jgi:predicted amidophosphoribosyltransferase